MGSELLKRRTYLAVAVVLAVLDTYLVIAGTVGDVTGGTAHDHHGAVLVYANILGLVVAAVVARTAWGCWRRSKSR